MAPSDLRRNAVEEADRENGANRSAVERAGRQTGMVRLSPVEFNL